MHLSPDAIIFWQYGWCKINATLVFTWGLMALLTLGAWWITRDLSAERRSRWQNLLEAVVLTLVKQIAETGLPRPRQYLAFLGSLFLFIASANLLSIVPHFEPPTASLSTTVALALCVFFAIPLYGVSDQGWRGYLKTYIEPTPIMLPFNLIGELSRTLALAVRLFGNMMSDAMIISILLGITPLIFPVVMKALGLLTGMVHAYIFTVLATVYIAAAVQTHQDAPSD